MKEKRERDVADVLVEKFVNETIYLLMMDAPPSYTPSTPTNYHSPPTLNARNQSGIGIVDWISTSQCEPSVGVGRSGAAPVETGVRGRLEHSTPEK